MGRVWQPGHKAALGIAACTGSAACPDTLIVEARPPVQVRLIPDAGAVPVQLPWRPRHSMVLASLHTLPGACKGPTARFGRANTQSDGALLHTVLPQRLCRLRTHSQCSVTNLAHSEMMWYRHCMGGLSEVGSAPHAASARGQARTALAGTASHRALMLLVIRQHSQLLTPRCASSQRHCWYRILDTGPPRPVLRVNPGCRLSGWVRDGVHSAGDPAQ